MSTYEYLDGIYGQLVTHLMPPGRSCRGDKDTGSPARTDVFA